MTAADSRQQSQSVLSERQLATICRETLRKWPEASAAVLFGSRARGTQREGSDWDMAIVLKGSIPEQPRPVGGGEFPQARKLRELDGIDAWALSESGLRDRAADLGTLPFTVCRDGRLLAGEWERPNPARSGKEPALTPEDWKSRMSTVLSKLDFAFQAIGRFASAVSWDECDPHCENFLETASDAAELLVKAAIERRGVSADRHHDIAKLADAFAKVKPEETALAERLASLNGSSRGHHTAMYYLLGASSRNDMTAAVRRLCGSLELWADEVQQDLNDGKSKMLPVLARSAGSEADNWMGWLLEPVTPKDDSENRYREPAEAALAGRKGLERAVRQFAQRMRAAAASAAAPTGRN